MTGKLKKPGMSEKFKRKRVRIRSRVNEKKDGEKIAKEKKNLQGENEILK